MAQYDGSIKIDSKINTKGFNSGMRTMTGGVNKLIGAVSRLAAVIGIAFSIGQIINFGKTAIDAASELSSAMVGLQSIVEGQGRSFQEAKGFIDDYISDGLVPATNAITAYKNLAMRGYDTTQIERTLTILKDTAAFGRQASYSIGEAVQTATEGLKNENSILVDNAGVTKNVAKMWEDYARQIGTTTNNLTQQQKIQAEVNGLIEESRFQTGDAQKVLGTYSGQVASLAFVFTNFKVAVGNIFIPIMQKILPVVRTVIQYLTIMANKVAQVVNLLLGTNVSVATSGMDQFADSTNSAAGAQENLAGATNDAKKAAKGALAAFDELNVLQMQEPTDQGVSATDTGISAGLQATEPVLDSFDQRITDFVDNLKLRFQELTAPLAEPFEHLKGALSDLGGLAWEGLQWAYENILVPLGEWFTTELAPVAIDLLASSIDLFNATIEEFKPYGEWLWENFLKPIAEWTGSQIIDDLNYLNDTLKEMAIIIGEQGLVAGFKYLFERALAQYINHAIEFLGSAINSAQMLFELFKIFIREKILKPVALFFMDTWGNIMTGFDTAVRKIKEGFESTFGGIKLFVKAIINNIIDYINGMLTSITTGMNGVIGGLNSIRVTIPSWVPNYGGSSLGFSIPTIKSVQIPKLATGAVIPPNSEFAAILGDQKNGRNIEAPEGLIRQIIQEEIGNLQAEFTINFAGSLAPLIREMYPLIQDEKVRIGGSLIRSGSSISS